MNMIMDSGQHTHQQHSHEFKTTPPMSPQARTTELLITTTSPMHSPTKQQPEYVHQSNNNNETQVTPKAVPAIVVSSKSTLKRSFDVAFLMMPDERIKQKQQQQQQQQQAEKQIRLAQVTFERHQYPTDLSPRSQQLQQQHIQMQQQQHNAEQQLQMELLNLQGSRHSRYNQINIRPPRIYDDPTVVIPAAAAAAAAAAMAAGTTATSAMAAEQHELQPVKSAFTKVTSLTRLESPPVQVPPPPPLSPDQLSCPSMSPPVATTPPRTNSGNGSLSNGSNNSIPPSCINPNMAAYQNFRPAEYQFNGAAFQSVQQVQALQAHRIKQQLLYRPSINGNNNINVLGPTTSPPEFLTGYPGFPFPAAAAAAAAAPFAAAAAMNSPELPRIVQNPAAAAIFSTLIPPTLASTFSLTAQNVCAKCNISFRMTSDLVYHMRSHHKSEVASDPNRRKREEKLKCPVCQESFRERHHLTRHMTAHQDKESDQVTSLAHATTNGHDVNFTNGPGTTTLINGNGNGNGNGRHHAAHAAVSRLANIPK